MASLKYIINEYVFDGVEQMNKKEIQNKFKKLNKYINFPNSLKKDEMITILANLSKYKNEADKYDYCDTDNKKFILNEEQIKVVKAPINKHIRIIACAGSGKTTTILYRIKYLLERCTLPERILVLTFNVEACNNLKKKIKEIFGFEPKVEIRTIDSLSAKLYYSYNHEMKTKYIKNISLSEYSIYAEKILEKFGSIICKNYDYVFFDEFQDVNDVHFRMLKNFAVNKCNLVVIGDDNQNIYQWRGTNNEYIINFDNIFNNTNTYTLSVNYRSNKSIIDLANKSIENNINRIEKRMEAINFFKFTPRMILYKKRQTVFKNIIQKIIKLSDQNEYRMDQFVILARCNTSLKEFEEYLTKYNSNEKNKKIPYISLLSEKDDDNRPIIEKNYLTLSSIHKSKGLEWDVVFIIGMQDLIFPSKMNCSKENIEEERRLFYVAVTRAKRYLYFMCCLKELPLSIFLREIYDKLKYYNNTKIRMYDTEKKIFWENEDSYIKKEYDVNEIIKLLRTSDYVDMRSFGLLPNDEIIKEKIFEKKLTFTDKIKKNYLESDLSIYCNRLITRSIMKDSNRQIINDVPTEIILHATQLTPEEMEIYNEYKMNNIITKMKYNKQNILKYYQDKNINEDHMEIICDILEKTPSESNFKFLRDNTYPKFFMKKINLAYKSYINKNNNNDDIMRDIYYVSLCEKFNKNRKRLVYKEVYDIFMENFEEIKNRINDYIYLINDYNNLCNIVLYKTFKIDNEIIAIDDNLILLDETNKVMMEYKYSDNTFKTEWLIESLIKYSLLMSIYKDKYSINQIEIVNIMKGKIYKFDIPHTYNTEDMIEYITFMLKRQIGSKNIQIKDENNQTREMSNESHLRFNVNNLMEKNNLDDGLSKREITKIEVPIILNLENYLIFDTETTGMSIYTSDIIQLSYLIYDKNKKIVKEVDRYITPEFDIISKESYNVHKISNKTIEKKGKKFYDVIMEFINDLSQVKYVIGHNVQFDMNMILSNLEKHNIEAKNIFDKKIIECTGRMSQYIQKSGNRMMKLSDLYRNLFGKEMLFAHNSLYDTKYCAKCYFKLKEIIEQKENKLILKKYQDQKKRIESIDAKYNKLINMYTKGF